MRLRRNPSRYSWVVRINRLILLAVGIFALGFSTTSPAAATDGVVPDPTTGQLLGTQVVTMDGSQEFFPGPGNDPLGGISGCGIVILGNAPTAHVYGTVSFVVSTAGDYTFRVVDSSPRLSGPDSSPYSLIYPAVIPTSDMFLALYDSTIDLATDPNQGVLGCNDDSDPYATAYGAGPTSLYTTSGQFVNLKFPQFSVTNLQPGTYTIVLTDWASFSAAAWAGSGYGTQSATFEFWGPAGSLTIIPPENAPAPQVPLSGSAPAEHATLASTGAQITTGMSLPVGLLSIGVLMLAISRVRARAR